MQFSFFVVHKYQERDGSMLGGELLVTSSYLSGGLFWEF